MTEFDEIEPLNEDEEGLLFIGPMDLLGDLEPMADTIAEIMAADVNTVYEFAWRNATLKMRAGSWQAILKNSL